MSENKNLPIVEKNKEIISLNPELYSDLSISELEERLELGCFINIYGCDCDGQGGCTVYTCVHDNDVCVADCLGDGGGGSGS